MANPSAAVLPGTAGHFERFRQGALGLCAIAMEAILLIMVCAAPWAYGAVHPGFEFLLYSGLGILLVFWAVRMLLSGQLTWKQSPVAVCMAGLFLIGMWQLMPLSPPWLEFLSPGTARVYSELLPREPEALLAGETRAVVSPPPGSTISLYPTATRQVSLQILAVFLLFAVVYNNIASAASLKRLAVAALVNGALLSLFALVQFFSSRPRTLYWSYTALGHVFGPFVNRNHFACYVNLCIGLAIGLIVSRNSRGAVGLAQASEEDGPSSALASSKWLGSVADLLHDPPALAACFAVTLMSSCVAFSLSRGGMIAVAGGVAVFAGFMALRSPHSLRLGMGLMMAALTIALSSWLGYGLIKARLATLEESEAIASRLDIWSDALPIVADFPVWGTGYGTFQYVERMQHTDAVTSQYVYDHAHNDYVELLIEGGFFALGLGFFAIGTVYRCGIKAVGSRDQATGGLVAGAMLGITTLVLHSIGEFGTHIPAITLLATVMSAQVCAQARSSNQARRGRPVESKNGRAPQEYRVSFLGLAPLLGAAACVALAAILCAAGWKAHLVDRLRLAALMAAESDTAEAQETRLAYLKTAASLAPDDADLLAELGHVGLREFERQSAELKHQAELVAAANAVTLPASCLFTSNPAMTAARLGGSTAAARQLLIKNEEDRLVRAFVTPALRVYLQARDRCPLQYEVQLGIAANVKRLAKAEAQSKYLHRAQICAPADPEVWYLSGLLRLEANDQAQAWLFWRQCLELSDRYLTRILDKSARVLSSAEIVEEVIPSQPERLLAAANFWGPKAPVEKRQPFLEKALLLLSSQPEPLTPQDLHTKVQVQCLVDQNDQALQTYRILVNRAPENVKYRYEFAEFLYRQGQLEAARRELLIVQAQQPGHEGARKLLDIVTEERKRK